MRILGFSKKDWMNYETGNPKLQEPEFTIFRFARRDRDWEVGELAQVVYKPRRKGGGEFLGIAQILSSEERWVLRGGTTAFLVSEAEAKADGFADVGEMVNWISRAHQARNFKEPMNKLTIRWVDG